MLPDSAIPNIQPVLFLDFDGVLHPSAVIYGQGEIYLCEKVTKW